MSEPMAARGGQSNPPRPGGRREPPSPGKRVVSWTLLVGVSYALTLTVLSDSFYLLAMPGYLGLVIAGLVALQRVLHAPFRGAGVPFATDGSDPDGAVRYHRSVILKRYAVIMMSGAVLIALPLVTTMKYFGAAMGVGLLALVTGTIQWLDQVKWLRRCARVLSVYGLEFRTPVQTLSLRSGGRRELRVGGEGSGVPTMSAHTIVGYSQWPAGIAEGVWFAGDEPFGGVLLVPGSGELMCMQPMEWAALAGERERAGAERNDKARRAGLDKRSM